MGSPTRDHVFPRFLGGRRWVHACKPCNDTFGHTIEAAANQEVFIPNHVMLSAMGLRHCCEGVVWKNAFAREGVPYNLIAGAGTTIQRLAKPQVLKRDSSGQVVSMRFPDEQMSRAFAAHATKLGLKLRTAPEARCDQTIDSLLSPLDFGPLMVRPALKIALAAASLLGVPRARLAQAQATLRDEPLAPVTGCTVVLMDYVDVKEFAKPLSHVVYVESTPDVVYAIVQFFGVLQIWCSLGAVPEPGSVHRALYGSLDPITGKKRFEYTTPLAVPPNLRWPGIPEEAYEIGSLHQWIVSWFQTQAVQRGGKDVGLRLGTPPPEPMTSESRGADDE